MADDLRAEIAHAIFDATDVPANSYRVADAILPIVRAYGDQRAAEALREAARDWPPTWALSPDQYLMDRADALAPADTPEAHRG